MAQPIKIIKKVELTEEQQKAQSLESLLSEVAQNKDSLLDTLQLLQELHKSGILDAMNSLVKAKEQVAKIAVGQMTREPVTNLINNAMAAGGALTTLDPEMTKKLMNGVANGLEKAEQGLQSNSKVGILDLLKVLNDPDINRAIGFGLNLLKGVGEGLKD
ncbi:MULTISPECIES: DUF1641 domain-containing protein [Neobacillus]|uniref:DUF1641 domain-containing protein n=1 Tax=Neobacillus rhizophilus TaxID=2833579 RepID=A0A942UAF1_9BACI|nr:MULTISPECIES: DUF1641 domain-containing protein [Neobacillus]MBS4214504.1 DUF1641 domain-containing protein [Neobacillus rhizophilus]MBU8918409.1 DUF1641 domain-containing protein [Bacillus sp. FJAT-29953]